MTDASEWIQKKLAGAPAELREAMQGAVAEMRQEDVPHALARGASLLYLQVAQGDGSRTAALPLLAADALLTHAFEAQAELDPSAVSALAAEWTAELGRQA